MPDSLKRVVDGLMAIATCIEERRPDQELTEQLRATQADCTRAASEAPSDELARWLALVPEVLETWQRVWPRLGAQRDFRLAVTREARLWSERLGGGR